MTCEVCGADTYSGGDGLDLCEGCDQPADACTCLDYLDEE